MLIPPFIKWIQPHLKRFFKLTEIDSQTKVRVSSKTYFTPKQITRIIPVIHTYTFLGQIGRQIRSLDRQQEII